MPMSLLNLSKYCDKNKLGIVLNEQNDILFINDGNIEFARREGEWTTFDYDLFRSLCKTTLPGISTDLIKQIFVSVVDVAFAHCGGSIIIVDDDLATRLGGKYVAKSDLLATNPADIKEEYKRERLVVFKNLINDKTFCEIDAYKRSEFLGIDGAMVIDINGKILSVGAILQKCAESGSGARTATMKGLSKKEKGHCISIKISADGYISVYIADKERLHIK